jgi:hypothetical protein
LEIGSDMARSLQIHPPDVKSVGLAETDAGAVSSVRRGAAGRDVGIWRRSE